MKEEYLEIIEDVVKALEGIRECIKADVAKNKCHMITKDKAENIFAILNQISTILGRLNIGVDTFERAYLKVADLLMDYDLYTASQIFESDILSLLEQTVEKLKVQEVDGVLEKKRTIKIKYVDFYFEFIPQEHWLYKLLSKKYDVVFSDTPDYLFFSCFGNQYLKYSCIRIFISNEAVYPNFNLYDYAVTYADFKVSDRLLPNQDAFEDLKYRRIANDRNEAEEIYANKEGFCNFVYSNGEGDPYRTELFNALNRYKQVLSGGKYLNNIGYRVENLEAFQSKFKFSIACENGFYNGYTTEKLINAFNAKTIPIYWGNEDISQIINSKAIINCHEFSGLQEIVDEVMRLDNDKEAYLEKLMQPILINENMPEEYLKEREKFIYNIFEQPYAEAFRRNRGLRGQWYNDWFCYALGYPNEWFSEEKNYFVKKR